MAQNEPKWPKAIGMVGGQLVKPAQSHTGIDFTGKLVDNRLCRHSRASFG